MATVVRYQGRYFVLVGYSQGKALIKDDEDQTMWVYTHKLEYM